MNEFEKSGNDFGTKDNLQTNIFFHYSCLFVSQFYKCPPIVKITKTAWYCLHLLFTKQVTFHLDMFLKISSLFFATQNHLEVVIVEMNTKQLSLTSSCQCQILQNIYYKI